MPIAALGAGASGDHIAHARQSREGARLAAQCLAQAAHFGEAARDQGRAGIITRAETVTHPDGDCDDVFQHAAQLTADDVLVGVNPEQPDVE